MWKRLAVFGALTVVLSGVGVGLYFLFRPHILGGPDIELNRKYYINGMWPGLLRYPDENGMPAPLPTDVITFQNKDHSYCIFENDFQIFRISFQHPRQTDMIFIVASITRGGGGLTAKVQHIYGGDIRTYYISTTLDKIILTSTTIYNVKIASEEYAPAQIEEIRRDNIMVMSFARTAPSYIQESAG